jgi:hypothetical protein
MIKREEFLLKRDERVEIAHSATAELYGRQLSRR